MKADSSKNIDVGKAAALHSAGWKNDKIADEMGITVEEVADTLQCWEKKMGMEDCEKEECTEQGKLIVLTSEELSDIYEKAATIGAKEALKVFKAEREREYNGRVDRRLRNTKLLLKNYHMLKEHAENSVFGRTQMEESAMDILESMMSMYDDGVIIESIKRSATRTAIIVSHIEVMFGLYRSYCEHTSSREVDLRRYGITWDTYMADQVLSAKEVAEKYNISTRNVYEDIKIATKRLTALIFGVDGLNVR